MKTVSARDVKPNIIVCFLYAESIIRNVGRRAFFRQFFVDVIVGIDELRGRPHIKIDDIVQSPDSILKKVIPVLDTYRSHRIEKRVILKQDRKSGEFHEAYSMNPHEEFFLRYFDGQHTLEKIARLGVTEFGLKNDDSYDSVKTLFCNLLKKRICQPFP